MTGPAAVPPEGWAAALAGLPGMGPARLRAVLDTWAPEEAWAQLAAGKACSRPAVALGCRPDPAGVAAHWRAAACRVSVGETWEAHRRAGVAVSLPGAPGFPTELQVDPEPPALVFSRGDPAALDGRRVAIVGTRRCTRYGREVAYELGRDLASSGICVVSGLALGIDGAAHRGALASGGAPPVAIVGSGLDVVYPPAHRALWEQVAEAGLLLSEAPLGARPEPWRFPVRNRVIAALAEVVIVVESPEKGGSRHTVEAAMAATAPSWPCPGRCAARSRPIRTGCWPMDAIRSGTRSTCWSPSVSPRPRPCVRLKSGRRPVRRRRRCWRHWAGSRPPSTTCVSAAAAAQGRSA